MPSILHDRFLALVEDAIVREIAGTASTLRDRPTTRARARAAAELDLIYKGRSATIELPAGVKRSPDATFYRTRCISAFQHISNTFLAR